MGSVMSLFPRKMSKEELEATLNKIKGIVSSTPVIVFSKTYCGYCTRVKGLLTQLGASYRVIELDMESKGAMNALSSDFMFGPLYQFQFIIDALL